MLDLSNSVARVAAVDGCDSNGLYPRGCVGGIRSKWVVGGTHLTLSTVPSNNTWVNQLSPGYFQWPLVFTGMDLSTRVLASFVRWILDAPGWELTVAGVLMNAGRGGGIILERLRWLRGMGNGSYAIFFF